MTTTGLALYDATARRSSAHVIEAYSTSFGLASKLLAPRIRADVATIYALVRVADEIVDGPAHEAGLSDAEQRGALDALERDVEQALRTGFSANLVVHAFAGTARRTGIGTDLTRPFFASMRRDLDPVNLTHAEFCDYVYGSAEVVGLMCLQTFLHEVNTSAALRQRLQTGARHLGAAFQKINFLRDLAEDYRTRGRRYFPDLDPATLTEQDKAALVADINNDLTIAADTMADLPPGCRRAVAAAHQLFAALAHKLDVTPVSELLHARVRVSAPTKAAVLLRTLAVAR